MQLDEFECCIASFFKSDGRRLDGFKEPRFCVHLNNNRLHQGQNRVGLMNNEIGALGNDRQIVVGNQGAYFYDHIGFWVKPSHLKIHPHQHAMQSRRIVAV